MINSLLPSSMLLFAMASDLSSAKTGWFDPRFDVPGANGSIQSLVPFRDALYAIGRFTRIAGVNAPGIARWDGTNWTAIARGFSAPILAAISTENAIYVSTYRTDSSPSAVLWRWNGADWKSLGAPDGYRSLPELAVVPGLRDFVSLGSDIYVEAESILPSATSQVLGKWDGQNWSIASATGNKRVGGLRGIAVARGNLFASGKQLSPADQALFLTLGELTGRHWSAIDGGIVTGAPALLASDGTNLYVQISYRTPFIQAPNSLAIWDGITWNVSTPESVQSLSVEGMTSNLGEVLISEEFSTNSATGAQIFEQYLVRYQGTNRTVLARGDVSGMRIIRRWRDGIYCTGEFRTVGGVFTGNLARWTGSKWARVCGKNLNGLSDEASAIAVSDTNIYVAGKFLQAGDVAVNHVARWDGTAWHAMGRGVDGLISGMAVLSNDLFVVGGFSLADNPAVTNVARWNGANWSAVGDGLDGQLMGIANGQDKILVARNVDNGSFFISQWDGLRWSNIVTNSVFGWVYSIVPAEDSIYIGGNFKQINGVEMNNAARWDGRQWNSLGSGLRGSTQFIPNNPTWIDVRTLLRDGSDLYAGGSFTNAGGIAARNVARWDGRQWSALGTGLPGGGGCFTLAFTCMYPVNAIAKVGDNVIAGGGFYSQYEPGLYYLARWGGNAWKNLGNGPWEIDRTRNQPITTDHSLRIWALASNGADLYVGGNFGTIEGVPSYEFAVWHNSRPPALRAESANGQITLSWPRPFQGATIEFTESLSSPNWQPVTGLNWKQSDTDTNDVQIVVAPKNRQVFYRLQW